MLQRRVKELDKVKEDLETVQNVDDGKLCGLRDSLEVQYHVALTVSVLIIAGRYRAEEYIRGSISSNYVREGRVGRKAEGSQRTNDSDQPRITGI